MNVYSNIIHIARKYKYTLTDKYTLYLYKVNK